MKRLALILLICLYPVYCLAQNRASDRIYWTALEKYTLALDSFALSRAALAKVTYLKVIYLDTPDFIDSIPPTINGYQIILLNRQNKKKIFLAHQRKLRATTISPVSADNGKLSITITPFFATLKKRNHYYYSVSDGTTVYFKFNCISQQFEYTETKNWGI